MYTPRIRVGVDGVGFESLIAPEMDYWSGEFLGTVYSLSCLSNLSMGGQLDGMNFGLGTALLEVGYGLQPLNPFDFLFFLQLRTQALLGHLGTHCVDVARPTCVLL